MTNERRTYRKHLRLSQFASSHRALGIKTFVHRQAVLFDPRGERDRNSYDPVNRVRSNSHLFRASITLARC